MNFLHHAPCFIHNLPSTTAGWYLVAIQFYAEHAANMCVCQIWELPLSVDDIILGGDL
jgi:hypothetical protein